MFGPISQNYFWIWSQFWNLVVDLVAPLPTLRSDCTIAQFLRLLRVSGTRTPLRAAQSNLLFCLHFGLFFPVIVIVLTVLLSSSQVHSAPRGGKERRRRSWKLVRASFEAVEHWPHNLLMKKTLTIWFGEQCHAFLWQLLKIFENIKMIYWYLHGMPFHDRIY